MKQSYVHHEIHHSIVLQPDGPHNPRAAYPDEHPIPDMVIT